MNSTYNRDSWRQFLVVAILVGLVVCILFFGIRALYNRITNPPQTTPTQPLLLLPTTEPGGVIPTSQPAVMLATNTPAVTTTGFVVGSRWVPHYCTADTPTRCQFAQEGTAVLFWTDCLDPELPRPVTFLESNTAFTRYEYRADGILHPIDDSNFQRFEFSLPEGGQK